MNMRYLGGPTLLLSGVLACSSAAPRPSTAPPPAQTQAKAAPPIVDAATQRWPYPATRVSDVVERLHGVEVHDPYRWLEDPSPEVTSWVDQEAALSREVLDRIPERPALIARLKQLFYTSDAEPYLERGGKYFSMKAQRQAGEIRRSFYDWGGRSPSGLESSGRLRAVCSSRPPRRSVQIYTATSSPKRL